MYVCVCIQISLFVCVWPAGRNTDACWLQKAWNVCVWVCVLGAGGGAWAVFSPHGLDKRLQSSASPWQQVLGYNLSVKLNGAWVTRPRAGVLPVSPITSAGPVACMAPSPADTYSVFIMWKKRLHSSTWLPQNNRAHFNSCTLWQQHQRGRFLMRL